MSEGRFTSRSRRRQDGFSCRVPFQTSSGGSGRRCTLVLMSMAGWYHACLGQSGIRSRAGALDIRSFLTNAAISSTGGQSSRVSSRDQCDANFLWHWRRRKTGCSPSGRRGNESRSAIIPSTTERRSVCLTATVSIPTKTGAQARLALSSSDGVPHHWPAGCHECVCHVNDTRVVDAESQYSYSLFLHAFSQCSHENHTNCLEAPDRNALCSILPFPYPLVLPLSRVPCIPRNVHVPPKPISAASVCIIPLVGSGRIGRPSVSLLANFLHICRSLID
jgi:hypothetical protein